MSKNNIKDKYLKKLNQLFLHNKAYYEESKPKVSDYDYDQLKNEILNIEIQYPFLKHFCL